MDKFENDQTLRTRIGWYTLELHYSAKAIDSELAEHVKPAFNAAAVHFEQALLASLGAARTPQRRVEMEWLPIESAPKDGSRILVYREGEALIAEWRNVWTDDPAAPKEWVGIGPRNVQGHGSLIYLEARMAPGEDALSGTPTHWMPLPDPPADWVPEGVEKPLA